MANDPKLKEQLLQLAARGERFETIDEASLYRWGLEGRSCRKVRKALDSLSHNEKFRPVMVGGANAAPLVRRVIERSHGGAVLKVQYTPRRRLDHVRTVPRVVGTFAR